MGSLEVNRISKVAIVGAGGNVGSHITRALLDTGKHTVTAITRADSQSKLPNGVTSKVADYDKPDTLVGALRGQDALVITISGRAPMKEIEEKLVRAAGEAGVPWIFPNEWSPDSANEGLMRDVFLFGMKVATRKFIQEVGKSSFVSVCTGFWYEYSLGMAFDYGFDFANRKATFYDDGETKISTSTWPQVGRAIAALLSLPVEAEDESHGQPYLAKCRNEVVYINPFAVSQGDILASALRVTGTNEFDWTIEKKNAQEQYQTGMKDMKEGRKPSANFLYSRVFFSGPDGGGDFEHTRGTLNSTLGLPQEEIDDATKPAIERQEAGAAH